MKLFKGQSAKDFSTKDIFDQPVKLSDYKGKKILIAFFRNTSCPFCNLRVHQLQKWYPRVKDEMKMIFVFESKKEVIRMSSFTTSLEGITVISDHDKDLYHSYGVEFSIAKQMGSFMKGTFWSQREQAVALGLANNPAQKDISENLIPADFLIKEDFTIDTAFYGKAIYDHLPIEQIETFVVKDRNLVG